MILKRDGPNFRHKEYDSLVYVTGKMYWYWNSRGWSINALDYLIQIRGYGLVDAAKYFPENCRHRECKNPYQWNATTVGYILDRQDNINGKDGEKQQAEDDEEFEDDGYGEYFDLEEVYGESEYLSEDDFDDKDGK